MREGIGVQNGDMRTGVDSDRHKVRSEIRP